MINLQNLEPQVLPARALVEEVRRVVPITCAILDNWGQEPGDPGDDTRRVIPRIIWGGPVTDVCNNACTHCPLYKTVGPDPPDVWDRQITNTLVPATDDQLATFTARQRMLNCKNLHQYLNAFAEWLVKQCLTPESAQEELDLWVTKFRILYYQDLTEARLSEIERTARAYIVHRAHLDLLIYGEARRAALLEQDAVSLGLIAG